MTRLRRLAALLRRALVSADAIAAAGIGSLAFGGWLAWPPAGFLVLGIALILVARYGTEAP